jgi:hypothetical protein
LENFTKKMTQLSGGRMTISGTTVSMDGQSLTCSGDSRWDGREQAYWTGGIAVRQGSLPEACVSPTGGQE